MSKLFCQNKYCNKVLEHYDTWRLPNIERVSKIHNTLSVSCKKCYHDFEKVGDDWIKNNLITQKQAKRKYYRKLKLNRILK